MDVDTFNRYLEHRISEIRRLLQVKADEYATDADRMHSFRLGSRIRGKDPAQFALDLFTKHLVSIIDIAEEFARGSYAPGRLIGEKCGDAIGYLILAEMLLREDYESHCKIMEHLRTFT